MAEYEDDEDDAEAAPPVEQEPAPPPDEERAKTPSIPGALTAEQLDEMAAGGVEKRIPGALTEEELNKLGPAKLVGRGDDKGNISTWGGYIPTALRSAARAVPEALADTLKGGAELFAEKPEENWAYKAGKRLKEGLDQDSWTALTPEERGSVTSQAVGTVAGVAPYLLVGGVPGLAAAAAQMGLAGAGQTGEAAREKGASPEAVASAAKAGGGLGAAGGAAMAVGAPLFGLWAARTFAPIVKEAPELGQMLRARATRAVAEGGAFAGIGEGMEAVREFIAQQYYDPNAAYHPDVKRIFASTLAGAFFGGMHKPVYKADSGNPLPAPATTPGDTAAAALARGEVNPNNPAAPDARGVSTSAAPVRQDAASVGNPASAPVRDQAPGTPKSPYRKKYAPGEEAGSPLVDAAAPDQLLADTIRAQLGKTTAQPETTAPAEPTAAPAPATRPSDNAAPVPSQLPPGVTPDIMQALAAAQGKPVPEAPQAAPAPPPAPAPEPRPQRFANAQATPPHAGVHPVPIEERGPPVPQAKVEVGPTKFGAGETTEGALRMDPNLPQKVEAKTLDGGRAEVPTAPFTGVHERVETALEKQGEPYAPAHKAAEQAENSTLIKAGVEPKSYQDALKPGLAEAAKEPAAATPRDVINAKGEYPDRPVNVGAEPPPKITSPVTPAPKAAEVMARFGAKRSKKTTFVPARGAEAPKAYSTGESAAPEAKPVTRGELENKFADASHTATHHKNPVERARAAQIAKRLKQQLADMPAEIRAAPVKPAEKSVSTMTDAERAAEIKRLAGEQAADARETKEAEIDAPKPAAKKPERETPSDFKEGPSGLVIKRHEKEAAQRPEPEAPKEPPKEAPKAETPKRSKLDEVFDRAPPKEEKKAPELSEDKTEELRPLAERIREATGKEFVHKPEPEWTNAEITGRWGREKGMQEKGRGWLREVDAAIRVHDELKPDDDFLKRLNEADYNGRLEMMKDLAHQIDAAATREGYKSFNPKGKYRNAPVLYVREARQFLDRIKDRKKMDAKGVQEALSEWMNSAELLKDGRFEGAEAVQRRRTQEGDESMKREKVQKEPGALDNLDTMTADEKAAAFDKLHAATPDVKVVPAWHNDQTNVAAPVVRSTTVRHEFDKHDFTLVGGPLSRFMPIIARRIKLAVPNAKIHFMEHADYMATFNTMPDIGGHYDPIHNQIFLPIKPRTPGELARDILHETIHAAVTRRMLEDPKFLRVIAEVQNHLLEQNPLLSEHYGMRGGPHEFLTEALTRKEFQEDLRGMEVTPEIAHMFDLKKEGWRKYVHSVWDGLVDHIRRAFGLPEGSHSALEFAVRLTDDIAKNPNLVESSNTAKTIRRFQQRGFSGEDQPIALHQTQAAQSVLNTVADRLNPKGNVRGLWFRGSNHLAMTADQKGTFDPAGDPKANPLHKITDAQGQRDTLTKRYIQEGDPHLENWSKLATKHGNDAAAEASAVSAAQPTGGVWFDLPKDQQPTKLNAWQERYYDEWKPRYDAMHDDWKQQLGAESDYHREQIEQIAYTTALNQLNAKGSPVPAALREDIARRAVAGTLTDKDLAHLGDWASDIKGAVKQALDPRPYEPARRDGRYAVYGKLKVVDEADALRERPKDEDGSRNFEFDDRAKAEEFFAKQAREGTLSHGYWVDQATGERERFIQDIDPVTHQPVVDANGKAVGSMVRYDKADPNVAQRWNVNVKQMHLELHPSHRRGLSVMKELEAGGRFEEGSLRTEEKKYSPFVNPTVLAGELYRMKQDLYKDPAYSRMSDSQKRAAVDAVEQAFLRMMGATRVHNSHMHRRNVPGYSLEHFRNLGMSAMEYGVRRASLETQPKINAAFDELRAAKAARPAEYSNAIQRLDNEFSKREKGLEDMPLDPNSWMDAATKRGLAVSFMTHLATPAFTIRNLTQPIMNTWPELAGKYGYVKATKALVQAYRDIGFGHTLWEGMKQTGRAAKGDDTPATLVGDMMRGLNPFERSVFEHLIENQRLDPDAGLQLAKLAKQLPVSLDIGTKESRVVDAAEKLLTTGDKTIRWMEDIARAMPQAAEAINRGVTALASLRLARDHGASPEEAFRAATTINDKTQFQYSDWNKPAWQRHPLARIPFQFKTFGYNMYETLGRHIGKAIKNANPGDRAAGLRALGGLAVTHMAVAGAMGLPWEPVRAMLIGAKATTGYGPDWDEVEVAFRKGAAALGRDALGLDKAGGAKFAEALARGLPRLLNMDLSPGLGVDNMALFGSPRAGSTEKQVNDGLKAWIFDLVGGAPGGTGLQLIEGMREVAQGDILKGLQNMSQFKVMADAIRAYRGATEGKTTDRGRVTMTPYTPYETGLRALGLPVAREAEQGMASHIATMHKKEDQTARAKLVTNWLRAKTPEDKQAAREKALDGGVAAKDLTAAVSRQKGESKRTDKDTNIVWTKRNRREVEELSGIYNVGR